MKLYLSTTVSRWLSFRSA